MAGKWSHGNVTGCTDST